MSAVKFLQSQAKEAESQPGRAHLLQLEMKAHSPNQKALSPRGLKPTQHRASKEWQKETGKRAHMINNLRSSHLQAYNRMQHDGNLASSRFQSSYSAAHHEGSMWPRGGTGVLKSEVNLPPERQVFRNGRRILHANWKTRSAK